MTTGLDVFDRSVQRTNEILEKIEQDFGWEGRRHQAYQLLRAVMHALRDRLPVDQSAHLAAELPILLKGVFYDGWSPARVPVKMNKEEFIQYIRQNFVFDVENDGIEKAIAVAGQRIFELVGPGEAENILNALPPEIAEIFVTE